MRFRSMVLSAAILGATAFAASAALALADDDKEKGPTTAEVLDRATADDWRPLDPENTLYMDLPAGLVVIELRPDFAPSSPARASMTASSFTESSRGSWPRAATPRPTGPAARTSRT